MSSTADTLPAHLLEMGGWVEIPGLGWLREVPSLPHHGGVGIDFYWWHDCPPLRDKPDRNSLRTIDTSSGERHAITGGSLAGGDLTIHGGSGSIPCPQCGLHGWVRGGKWVAA
jgi:hypothetical protein